jgi:uncharacterized surface anchored protein
MLVRLYFVLAVFAASAIAQDFRATLQGTVSDPTAASVANAQVTLRNTDTGVERTVETDAAGAYLFQFLIPGNYQLTVKAPGFRTLSRGGIQLSVTQTLREDLTLAVGDAAETVEVTASVGTVETDRHHWAPRSAKKFETTFRSRDAARCSCSP